MSTPEPLDEFHGGVAETRGGDHFADIVAPKVSIEGTVTRPEDDDLACDCGGDHGGEDLG